MGLFIYKLGKVVGSATALFEPIAVALDPLPRAGRRRHHQRHCPRSLARSLARAREWCEIRLTRVLNLEFRCRYVLVILPLRSGVFTDDPEGAKCVLQDTEMDEMPSSSACGNNSESARQPCLARSINACAALCSPGKSGARCQFVRPLLSATRPTGAINLRRNGKRLTS